ncbi:MAG: DUF4112 domain-containing protein [Cyanobacteria bacterium P01_H01_bin.119]
MTQTATGLASALKRVRAISKVMDNAIAVPGTDFKFGLDPILGLLPGGGDLFSGGISVYILYEAMRLGIPKATLLKMAGNIVLELIVGTIPVLGDAFDVAWKANAQNVKLMEQHIDPTLTQQPLTQPGQPKAANQWFALVLIVGLLALIVLAAIGTVWILAAIFNLLSQ